MEYEIITIKPGEELSQALELREEIFGFGEDDLDEVGISLILKEDGKAVAAGRLLLDMESDRLIIDMIGVKEECRRRHLATRMLTELMKLAAESGADEVWAKPKKNEIIIEMLKKHGFDELNPYWMSAEMQYYFTSAL